MCIRTFRLNVDGKHCLEHGIVCREDGEEAGEGVGGAVIDCPGVADRYASLVPPDCSSPLLLLGKPPPPPPPKRPLLLVGELGSVGMEVCVCCIRRCGIGVRGPVRF